MNGSIIENKEPVFKVAVIELVPEVQLTLDENNNIVWASGFAIEVIKMIILYLKVDKNYKLVLSPDGTYGNYVRRKWTGIIGMLLKNEINMTMTLICTEQRAKVLDFVHPHQIARAYFILKAPAPISRALGVVKPFTLEVWICIITIIPALAAILSLLTVKFDHQPGGKRFYWTYGAALWYMIGGMLNTGCHPPLISRNSTKLSLAGFLIYALVIFTSFTGKLVAFMNIPTFEEPIDTLDQLGTLIVDGKYTAGSVKGTIMHNALVYGKSGKLGKIGHSAKLDPDGTSSPSIKEGVERVLKENYAFIWGGRAMDTYAKMIGIEKFHSQSESFATFSLGNALIKGSPIFEPVNRMCIRLDEMGLLLKFMDDNIDRQTIPALVRGTSSNIDGVEEAGEATPLKIIEVQSAFWALFLGYAAAILVFAMECFSYIINYIKSKTKEWFKKKKQIKYQNNFTSTLCKS